ETDPAIKKRLTTIVVVGGGANGVEVAAEIRDLIHEALEHYHNLSWEDFRIILIHATDRLMPDLPENMGEFAEQLLRSRGVEVMLNRFVSAVEPTRVLLKDGSIIETETVIASVGVDPNPLIRDLDLEKDRRGRLMV